MMSRPYIVYLDQNKWIELARAAKSPKDHPAQHALLMAIAREVGAARLILPLTSTNIYETHKINDPRQRQDLAMLQACASQGLVFRGRHHRLEAELSDFWRILSGRPFVERAPLWFLSDVFFEAYADWNDPRLVCFPLTERIINVIRSAPPHWLYSFLMETPEDVRVAAVKKFSDGSEKLRQQIEEWRQRNARESLAVRRRINSVRLVINEFELILGFAQKFGFAWNNIGDMDEANVRRIVEDIPTYYVERELTLRLEAQSRPIDENDFRDMQSFCAIIPYADVVVGEKQFINLARQARLDKKFSTRLRTNVLDLVEDLAGIDA